MGNTGTGRTNVFLGIETKVLCLLKRSVKPMIAYLQANWHICGVWIDLNLLGDVQWLEWLAVKTMSS